MSKLQPYVDVQLLGPLLVLLLHADVGHVDDVRGCAVELNCQEKWCILDNRSNFEALRKNLFLKLILQLKGNCKTMPASFF